jgi:pantothenate kinase type III
MNTNTCLFADVGNSTTDIVVTDFTMFKTYKFNSRDRVRIRKMGEDLLNIHHTIQAYISSVDILGLTVLTKQLEFLKIPYYTLTPSRMEHFCLDSHYDVPNIQILGKDLFCDIVSRDENTGLIIIDLGTASKILYIDKQKRFQGGQIFPGLYSAPSILSQKTDLLKNIELIENPPLLSLKTDESISSGVINGTAGLINSMVKAIREKYQDPEAKVILTGGNGKLVNEQMKEFGFTDFETDLHLVTEGLAHIYGFSDFTFFKEEINNEKE